MWDKNKIERVQTQFLKQILGCNYQTSQHGKGRYWQQATYQYDHQTIYFLYKNIQSKKPFLCYDSLVFETENSELPNLYSFNKNFGLNVQGLIMKSKGEVNKICNGNYDFGVVKYHRIQHILEQTSSCQEYMECTLFQNNMEIG